MQYGIRSHSQNNENPLWWLLTPGKVQFMCVTFGQLKSLDSIPLKKTSPNSQFVNAILCSSVFHLTQLHSFWLSNVCSLFLSLSLLPGGWFHWQIKHKQFYYYYIQLASIWWPHCRRLPVSASHSNQKHTHIMNASVCATPLILSVKHALNYVVCASDTCKCGATIGNDSKHKLHILFLVQAQS